MQTINKKVINGIEFYVVHRNYVTSILPKGCSIARIGGSSMPNSYDVYFIQNPKVIFEILSSNNKCFPEYSSVTNMLHWYTAQDLPWIHSNINKVRKVLVTDLEFGQGVEGIKEVYKVPEIYTTDNSEFSKNIAEKLGITVISNNEVENETFDAIFVSKSISEYFDFSRFKRQYYNTLTDNGETILVMSNDTFKQVYESEEEFRLLFDEFGYASSVKNIGSLLDNDLILHFRKATPDYSEVMYDGAAYPNIYVAKLIEYIQTDKLLMIKLLQSVDNEDLIDKLYQLIRTARLKNFMYLPNVEKHIQFICNHITN